MNLDGVEGRPGVYGKQKKSISFTIGRRQVSTVDASAKTMKVERDGAVIKTLPITAGAPSTTTYNGQMVISEKYKVTRMNGATVGFGGEYDIKDVPHAMRLSNSGTFVHGNYWAPASTLGPGRTEAPVRRGGARGGFRVVRRGRGGCIHGRYVDLARVNGGRVSDYGRRGALSPKVPSGARWGKSGQFNSESLVTCSTRLANIEWLCGSSIVSRDRPHAGRPRYARKRPELA
ncbi:hypothetical protein STANM309S_02236 [Streptomyces tanashiensis]